MLDRIWEQFLHVVKEEVGSRVVETWFKSVTLEKWDRQTETVFLKAPNDFIRDWILKHYRTLLTLHLGRLLHVEHPSIAFIDEVEINTELVVMPKAEAKIVPAHSMLQEKRQVAGIVDSKYALLNKNYVFSTFVVDPSNSLAYAAAHAVAEKPGQLYNPLFIYGKSGLGKTHLMHAIAHEMKKRNKRISVIYQSADRFVQEFISAIRFDTVHTFRTKYQSADVLLIDDIQFMAHKEQTQEAFFQLFNILYDAQKQIVFSSDTYPQDINGIAERLRSRLAWGLVTDVQMPSIETKMAILKKKAERNNVTLSDEVADFIASNVTSNVRELEGALVRVLAFASLAKQVVTLELATNVLFRTMHTYDAERKHAVDFEQILKCIAKHYKYSLHDLRSKNRNKDLVFARHVAMFLMKNLTKKSLRDIGSFLGSRNHTTVKHAILKIEEHTKTNQDFRLLLSRMQQEVLQQ